MKDESCISTACLLITHLNHTVRVDLRPGFCSCFLQLFHSAIILFPLLASDLFKLEIRDHFYPVLSKCDGLYLKQIGICSKAAAILNRQ